MECVMCSGVVSPRAPMLLADEDVPKDTKNETNLVMWIIIGIVW